MDIRRCMVLGMVSSRRVDVHSIHPEPLCHISGQICGRCQTCQISEPHEQKTSKSPHCGPLGTVLRHMLPAARRMERPRGTLIIHFASLFSFVYYCEI